MRQISVVLHREAGVWWAEAPAVPGFSALGKTRDELMRLVREGLELALPGEAFSLVEDASPQLR